MEWIASYLLKSCAWLTGFFVVYTLFLRNERYFTLKRIYLLTGLLASIFFPLFTFTYPVYLQPSSLPVLNETAIVDGQADTAVSVPVGHTIWIYIYFSGVFFFLLRTLLQARSVMKVIRNRGRDVTRNGRLIRASGYASSFSFFHYIFIHPSVPDPEKAEIMNHETEHVRQMHWLDLTLCELLCIYQWFNPFVWIYRMCIRQNNEYLADEKALKKTVSEAVYKAALLNQSLGWQAVSLTHSFAYSINKKRFDMMKKIHFSPLRKTKLLLILPIVVLVFYAFSTPEYRYMETAGESSPAVAGDDEDKTLKGQVVQEEGKPLQGAAVMVMNTTIGTLSDASGHFMLRMPGEASLVISYVGYKTIKVAPDFRKEMIVRMVRDTISMQGVEVKNTEAGKEIKSETPLVLLGDHEITMEEMKSINPELIESINVLNDETATRVYGEKGKNGVIIITLKDKEQESPETDKEVYVVVEELPMFPGGEGAMMEWIVSQIRYPSEALKEKISGEVLVQFTVDSRGKVGDIKVIRSVHPLLDAEAVRVVSRMPGLKPGKQNGKAVDVICKLPVAFRLEQEIRNNNLP